METLSSEWLLAIGIILIGLETITISFILLPIGVGFLFVAIIHNYIYEYASLYTQIATAFVVALILFFTLRKKFLELLNKSQQQEEEQTMHNEGIGTIDGEQIRFEGSFYLCENDLSTYEQNEKVHVKIVNNRAVISKL